MTEAPESPKASGLKTALDIVVAPKEALESLRLVPTWGWALFLTLLFYVVGSYLVTPAVVHGVRADWPHTIASSPRLAALTPAQQAQNLAIVLKVVQFAWIFALVGTPIVLLIQTAITYLFRLAGKGDASFAQLWAANVNVAVPVVGINALVVAAIVLIRGTSTFNSANEITTVLPSLAWFVPSAAVKLHAFLSAFNVFTLWGLALTILAMSVVARVPPVWAWLTGIVLLLFSAGLVALGAR